LAETKPFEYLGLADLTDANKLASKRESVESLRTLMKREWALNRVFYNGQQWSWWNPQMYRVESLPVEYGPKWRVRLVSNQIKPGLAHYVAQLTKTRPTINAEPDSGADADVKAAQMAESLYEYMWDDKQLNAKLQAALMEAGLSGGYWKITWDPLAGKAMSFTLDPNGQPILDDDLAQVFLDNLEDQLEAAGQDPRMALQMAKQTVYLGDIRIEVMMAENVLLDPSAHRFEECNWAICKHVLDPDEIKARWGVTVTPNVTKSPDSPPMYVDDRRPETLRDVYIMYVRPCPAQPKGRYVAWIEGPNTILQDMDWPYPFSELPLVKFPGIHRPDSPYDDPIVTDVRPLQKSLNKALSQIIEHQNLVLRPQVLAVEGTLTQKVTTEPGLVIEYRPAGNYPPPQWRDMPDVPGSLFTAVQMLTADIAQKFNKIPSQRDQLPARIDSGDGIESIQETIADQLSPVIIGIEDALARAGHLIAAYAQEYYEEPRLLKIRGQGGSVQVKRFMGSDIAGGFTFRPRYGTGLPRTREGKRQAIMELVQAQLIDPVTAMKHLDLADLKGVQAQMARDEDQALREHEKMLNGQPINVQALQEAQEAMQQFQQQAAQVAQMLANADPSQPLPDFDGDGQPDDPQEVVQQIQQQAQQLQQQLEDAPWQPLDYENWDAHLQCHSDLMKTQEFERYDPQVQAIFVKHWQLTYQRKIDVMFNMPNPDVKPTINVRTQATVSAPVMAKLLGKAGIQTDPDEVAEPPLDTQVYDMLNQPQQGSSGNSPMDPAEQAMMMQHAQDEHEAAQAKVVQQMGLEEARAEREDAQAQMQQEMMQLQGLGQVQKLQHAQEQHQQRMKQAKQPKPKPGNGSGRQ